MTTTAPIQIIEQSLTKDYSIIQISNNLLEKVIIREQWYNNTWEAEECSKEEIQLLSQTQWANKLESILSSKVW